MLPEQQDALWTFLLSLDSDTQDALFAHCAGLTVNAVHENLPDLEQTPACVQLAQALGLDMEAQGFINDGGQLSRPHQEAADPRNRRRSEGEQTAELLADHKKKDMAAEAERLLSGTWLAAGAFTHARNL